MGRRAGPSFILDAGANPGPRCTTPQPTRARGPGQGTSVGAICFITRPLAAVGRDLKSSPTRLLAELPLNSRVTAPDSGNTCSDIRNRGVCGCECYESAEPN